ncbi:hypothetical protein PF005_g29412, partial [Phytophthora fragariae]
MIYPETDVIFAQETRVSFNPRFSSLHFVAFRLLRPNTRQKSDEVEKELVAQKPELKRSHSPAVDNLSVPLLMKSLDSDQTADKDKTLLKLIRKCVTSKSRVQVYKADGIQLFAGLVQRDESYLTQL